MLATGVSMTAAATIALAPLPADPLPSTRSAAVALTGAWQDFDANTAANLAGLFSLITNYPPAPILSQVAENVSIYARWLQGQDGGTPALVAQTIAQHVQAVGVTMVSFAIATPLSFIGPFIAPGVMIARLIAETAAYPSTPATVLQAFLDAPANYLDITLNCCSTPLFELAFGLLNPGPLGYLLQFAPAIAAALKIPTPAPAGAQQPAVASAAPPAAAQRAVPAPAVAESRRAQSVATAQKTVVPSSEKRPAAVRKAAAASAEKATSGGKGQSARPGSRGTR